jgi:hypothetical protein
MRPSRACGAMRIAPRIITWLLCHTEPPQPPSLPTATRAFHEAFSHSRATPVRVECPDLASVDDGHVAVRRAERACISKHTNIRRTLSATMLSTLAGVTTLIGQNCG